MEKLKDSIYETLRAHTGSVNSFIDGEGKNLFMPCVDALYSLLTYRDFPRDLRTARRNSNMTQEELGKIMGWSKSFISLIEAGKRDVSEKDRRMLLEGIRAYSKNSL